MALTQVNLNESEVKALDGYRKKYMWTKQNAAKNLVLSGLKKSGFLKGK